MSLYLSVHVGAVHVDLSAVAVHEVDDVNDLLLEHSVSTRVGDHEGGQVIFVLLGLGAQVSNVDVARLVTLHHHNLKIEKDIK